MCCCCQVLWVLEVSQGTSGCSVVQLGKPSPTFAALRRRQAQGSLPGWIFKITSLADKVLDSWKCPWGPVFPKMPWGYVPTLSLMQQWDGSWQFLPGRAGVGELRASPVGCRCQPVMGCCVGALQMVFWGCLHCPVLMLCDCPSQKCYGCI